MEDELIETVNYRGYSIPVYLDDYGQSYYGIIDGEEVGFGSFNTEYVEEIKTIIDEKLDTIEHFLEYGGKLQWFDNHGWRDLRLYYQLRLVKVWIVEDETKVDLDTIKKESLDILSKLDAFEEANKDLCQQHLTKWFQTGR